MWNRNPFPPLLLQKYSMTTSQTHILSDFRVPYSRENFSPNQSISRWESGDDEGSLTFASTWHGMRTACWISLIGHSNWQNFDGRKEWDRDVRSGLTKRVAQLMHLLTDHGAEKCGCFSFCLTPVQSLLILFIPLPFPVSLKRCKHLWFPWLLISNFVSESFSNMRSVCTSSENRERERDRELAVILFSSVLFWHQFEGICFLPKILLLKQQKHSVCLFTRSSKTSSLFFLANKILYENDRKRD